MRLTVNANKNDNNDPVSQSNKDVDCSAEGIT